MMIAMSRGCFVLHISFVTKSHEEGKFIEKDEFEFGNPAFKAGTISQDQGFEAPYKWRRWITYEYPGRFTDGAFSGKTFIIATKADRYSKFSTIIKGGGGKLHEVNLSETFNPEEIKKAKVDQCFFEGNMLSERNVQILKECRVSVKRLASLIDFFMSDALPK
jgi:hypothetical protein